MPHASCLMSQFFLFSCFLGLKLVILPYYQGAGDGVSKVLDLLDPEEIISTKLETLKLSLLVSVKTTKCIRIKQRDLVAQFVKI